jgi:hypothetical protein
MLTTMASRRPPSSKGVDPSDDPEMTKSPLKSPTKSVGKNHAVICLAFFNILTNTARAITSHIWRQVTCSKKEDVLKGLLKLSIPLSLLIGIPLLVLQEIPSENVLTQLYIVWTALLHITAYPVVVLTSAVALRHVLKDHGKPSDTDSSSKYCNRSLVMSCIYIIAGVAVLIIVNCQIQVIYPSWLWNPFLWGRYPIYLPSELSSSLKGVCIDDSDAKRPLCLSESSWKTLSAGALSSRNTKDVQAVKKGLEYAQKESGGLVINVMSRDTVDAIPALQQNVEALLPLFKHVAVVVFENDSKDGTREAFKQWASVADGYTVDIMSCGDDNPDCKFGISHRYDATEAKNYFASSAIGKMADYRQRISDYILDKYDTYSHMMVIDLDLKVSLSPFGILHTLGTVPDVAVASSGRQVWPGSLGTIVPPYDFSAFRPIATEKNQHLLNVHQWFCELLPEGDRWRNQCDATSSIHLLFVLMHDWLLTQEPYAVASAFNGATMYPLALVKKKGAKYDVGDDGQRCEHIGYNLAMPFVTNPKWTFHVLPTNPGGPTGVRSLKNVFRIVFKPRLSMVIFFQLMVFLVTFVLCVMAIALQLSDAAVGTIKAVRNDSLKLKETELPLHYSDFMNDGKDDECDTAFGKRHLSVAAKRTSPKASPTTF